jgi:hypothetical protein
LRRRCIIVKSSKEGGEFMTLESTGVVLPALNIVKTG